MFKEGIGLLICWLMMRMATGTNKELVCMFMHVIGVGFGRPQTSKDGLYHFLLVVLPSISP